MPSACARGGPRRPWCGSRGPGFQELIAWGRDAADVLDAERGEASLLLALAALDDAGGRVTPRVGAGARSGQGPHALAAIAGPQGLAVATGATVFAATDHVGLAAVYHAAADGVAVAGSSSRLLAALLGRRLDDDAVSAFSVLGEYASRTRRSTASGGWPPRRWRGWPVARSRVDQYAAPPAPQRGPRDVDASVAEGVDAVRAAVGACVDAYPDAAMELSGGLDSRIILAALVSSGRPPAGGLTLGEPSHPDVLVARELARRAGVPFQQVDLTACRSSRPPRRWSWWTRPAGGATSRATASRSACWNGSTRWPAHGSRASPARTASSRAASTTPSSRRGRGPTTRSRARCVRWRLMANERVSGGLLAPEATAAGERRAERSTRRAAASDGLRLADRHRHAVPPLADAAVGRHRLVRGRAEPPRPRPVLPPALRPLGARRPTARRSAAAGCSPASWPRWIRVWRGSRSPGERRPPSSSVPASATACPARPGRRTRSA